MSDQDASTSTNSRALNVPAVCFWGCCPRCGDGKIFRKFLGLKSVCPVCAMDLGPYDQADGPAFFVILIAGAIMTPIALWVARAFQLSGISYIALMSGLTLIVVILMLRLAKALLIVSQYKTDAREGRLDEGPV